MKQFILFLVLSSLILGIQGQIPSECLNLNSKSFPPASLLLKCFNTVGISEENKGDILETMGKFFKMYSYQDIVKDSPSSPPLMKIQIDLEGAIKQVRDRNLGKKVSAWSFYEDIQQNVFLPLMDAHTMLVKPSCFNGVFFQPFKLEGHSDGNSGIRVQISSLSSRKVSPSYWPSPDALARYVGKTITKIGGRPVFDAISEYSRTHSWTSKDPSVSFNDHLFVHYLWRPTRFPYNLKESNMTYTFSDGSTLNVPWAGNFTGDLSKCNPNGTFEAQLFNFEKERLVPMATPSDSVAVFPLYNDPSTLVAKIPNFHDRHIWRLIRDRTPSNGRFTKLIVDLRQNGGGIVCEGLHLIEYLTSPPPPILYDLRRSQNSDALVDAALKANANNVSFWGPRFWSKPYSTEFPYRDWYGPRKLNRGGVVGDYSNLVEFGDRQCKGPSTTTKFDKILLLTDGHCGSTCAVFSNLLSTVHNHVRTVTVGGLPNRKDMSFSTFAGGIVLTDQALFAANDRFKIQAPFVPKKWPTDVSMRVPHMELYLNDKAQYPVEFVFLGSDFKLDVWPSVYNQSSFRPLYNQVNQLFDRKEWTQGKKR
eukprot:TRINITY_DN4072_c0_g1_i2.p1 TRINITY_DN4072_c0_g1~~TRINITY_DN4072_c0_g1_i2.p1  ORF type:complete len:590 (-),score=114.76 TRINITY_DN4072_c0_g1_i2:98-1867(-)